MIRSLRFALAAWEVLLVIAALGLLWSGSAWAPFVLVYALINAGIVGLALVLERPRYGAGGAAGRAGASDEPLPPGFAPTDEVFIDPTSGARLRVWADTASGERRYRPDHRS